MIGEDFEVSSRHLIEVLCRKMPGEVDKTTKKSSFRKASVLAEIRTEHFLNTSSERHLYTSVLGVCDVIILHAVTIRS
jgi:hypothetical protein